MKSEKSPINRREMLWRSASTVLAASAIGTGAVYFFDERNPVREKPAPQMKIPDRRVVLPATLPKMVIARGTDPARNVAAVLERLGGMKNFVGPQDIVVIKPNVSWDRKAEQAANTNPQVIGALVRACREAGAKKIIVTDNSVNDPMRCFERSGVAAEVRRTGGDLVLPGPDNFVDVFIPGQLGVWPVLKPFVEATKIINVPLVKHHSLTSATIGMKNWYGILGGGRYQLHQRIDNSVAELAAMMLPTLTVIDATRMLMRNGPTGGSLADVKEMNTLCASLDPVAADAWGAELLGADLASLRWLQLGQEKHLGQIDWHGLLPIEITT